MSVSTRFLENFAPFGRCLVIQNDVMEAYVTVDVGPRVIRLGKPGGSNLFFADYDGVLTEKGDALRAAYGDDAIYRFYGGHRLWMSPELIETTYAPDNDPVAVTISPHGAEFTPPPQTCNGLQFSMRLTLDEDKPEMRVDHFIENIGHKHNTFAPWAITQLAPGGFEILPQSKQDTGLLPDRAMAFWPYTDMGDARITWGDDVMLVRQEESMTRAFKIAFYNRKGWGVYVLGDTAFIKQYAMRDGGTYPDGGMNFETFTNNYFIEMETLGPLDTTPPGERVTHTETWRLAEAPSNLDRLDPAACLAFTKNIL